MVSVTGSSGNLSKHRGTGLTFRERPLQAMMPGREKLARAKQGPLQEQPQVPTSTAGGVLGLKRIKDTAGTRVQ